MENTFRRAVFGGFNRQDVTEYISRTAREYSERLEQLEQENMNLRTQLEQKADLEQTMERLRGEYENAAQQLAEERTAREQLRRELEVSSGQAVQLAQLRQEAAEYITQTLHRGVTCWTGKGAYTGEEIQVLYTCLNKYEINELREALAAIDSHAFLSVQEGVKISGNFQKRLL